MSTFLYELPTTGAITFGDFCVDRTSSYTRSIAAATQARANVRASLKEIKRADSDRDYLRLIKVLDDYLPHLYGLKACFGADEIDFSTEPIFSWRTTLSANILHNSPRQEIRSLDADLSFTLLTYAFALSNLARSNIAALGRYEYERSTSNTERKEKDEKLNFATTLLCRASGVYHYLSDTVLPEWDRVGTSPGVRPPDITPGVTAALSKMALADAQTLAIRKYLSKAAYDSTLSPGPPLPESHPRPLLLAKLYLECESLYSSARALVKTQGKSKGQDSGEVSADLRHYLGDEAELCGALGRKWLGVDAGEHGGQDKAGIAVSFCTWAKSGLEDLKDGGKGIVGKAKDLRETRKARVTEELASVTTFLKYYKKLNDSMHYQPVPPIAELQSSIPTGRLAIAMKPYTPPIPAFGPGSLEYTRWRTESIHLESNDDNESSKSPEPSTTSRTAEVKSPSYAGEGSYF